MKVGDKAKIVRRTFLHQGIFVHTGSQVEIQSMEGSKVVGKYMDKEGFPHDIEFQMEDLEVLE